MKWTLTLFAAVVIGVTTLRGDVVINEIFYNAPDDLDLEFIELFHPGKEAIDVSKWTLSDRKDTLFTFPDGSAMLPGSYVVLCREPALFEEFYGFRAAGELAHGLGNGGDEVLLKDATGEIREKVTYDDSDPWPTVADGYSASLERISPVAPSGHSSSWAPSPSSVQYQSLPGGTPGKVNASYLASAPPSIERVVYENKVIPVGESVSVALELSETTAEAKDVRLVYRLATTESLGEETTVPMRTKGKRFYETTIPGQSTEGLLRFRVIATGKEGAERVHPHPDALRPMYSLLVSAPIKTEAIPAAYFILPTEDLLKGRSGRRSPRFGRSANPGGEMKAQGTAAIAITDPQTKQTELFDFIHITRRTGGYKVRLHKDRLWREISTLNVLEVYNPRHSLCESLAFELHRRAGVPASWADYFRLTIDGQAMAFHLAFEQPNKSFLRRHKLDDDGNLFKAIWQGSHRPSARAYSDRQPDRLDVIGRHEKKTNVHEDYEDLIGMVEGLEAGNSLDPPTEVINYFAVNSLLSHWDGFHNNYFLYHEISKKTDKWWMFPWDQDKTWGLHDGIRGNRVFYDMPLRAGTESYLPPGVEGPVSRYRNSIGLEGAPWWRYGGELSRTVLEHPETRQLFLRRVRELATTVFTEEAFGPEIDRLETRLLPELRWQSEVRDGADRTTEASLRSTLQVFREHLQKRRQFVLEQDEIRNLP